MLPRDDLTRVCIPSSSPEMAVMNLTGMCRIKKFIRPCLWAISACLAHALSHPRRNKLQDVDSTSFVEHASAVVVETKSWLETLCQCPNPWFT